MSAPKNQVVPAAPGCCLVGVDHVDQNSPYTMESYSPENRIPIVGWVVNADKVDPINKERGDGMTSSGLSYYLADPVVIESPMPRGVTYAIKMADSERLCDPELREYQNEESFFESVKNSTARDKQKLSVICVDRDRPASAVWSLNFKCRPCLREFFTNNNGGPIDVLSALLPVLPHGWRWKSMDGTFVSATALSRGNACPENKSLALSQEKADLLGLRKFLWASPFRGERHTYAKIANFCDSVLLWSSVVRCVERSGEQATFSCGSTCLREKDPKKDPNGVA